jgi:YHS domain-containing protein
MEHDNNSTSSSGRFQAKTACGGVIDDPENFPSAIYRGERVYFCTLACLKAFEQNPDPFMAGEIEHPTD